MQLLSSPNASGYSHVEFWFPASAAERWCCPVGFAQLGFASGSTSRLGDAPVEPVGDRPCVRPVRADPRAATDLGVVAGDHQVALGTHPVPVGTTRLGDERRDQDQRPDPVGDPVGGRGGHEAAERVADQHDRRTVAPGTGPARPVAGPGQDRADELGVTGGTGCGIRL